MAERRMFTKKVTDDDNFMNLSASAQALYLHLSMSADDDGFSNQVNVSMFKAHASIQDLQALLEKRYIYQFDNGVIVIKHWRMANALRKDRYTPTAFQEELKRLSIKENGSYTLSGNQLATTWQPDGNQRLPQDSIDKNSIDKDRLEIDKKRTRFTPPTLSEVQEYVKERNSQVDPKQFYDYFTAGEWKDSKGNQVKNWKQKLITWEKFNIKEAPKRTMNNFTSSDTTEEDLDDWSKKNQDDFYSRWGGDE